MLIYSDCVDTAVSVTQIQWVMKNATTVLTEKETLQLNRFRKGMDAPNCGWLDQMEVFDGKVLSGIVSSLVKKGAILSIIDDQSFWIEVADEWQI